MHKDRSLLTAAQWARLSPLLPGQQESPGTTARDTRLFVEAVRWRARCGVSWPALPAERCGPWQTVYARFRRWRQARVWPQVLAPGAGPGAKRDGAASAAGRLHGRAGAPGGRRRNQKDRPVGQALGRSRGGFPTQRHLRGQAPGRMCALALTGGQAGDCPPAPGLPGAPPAPRAGQARRPGRRRGLRARPTPASRGHGRHCRQEKPHPTQCP